MFLIHTADNFLEAQQLKQLLIENGIDCMTKGETSMSSGAAAGELPPALMKNTLHVFSQEDVSKATELVSEYLNYSGLDNDWVCPNCKETVDKEFYSCWNCNAEYQSN